ncbi:alcohol acetyltransferase [Mariannaea sp. PMI_226]|nr:alcohol acetyltransferase [Mariannaea sp. PMI_226]
MAQSSAPRVIRPLGKLEAYSSSRHVLGIYRCVVVSARYTNPHGSNADAAFLGGLAQLVARQPMLRVGIIGEDTNTPKFVHVPQVDLLNHVVFRSLPAGEDYETGLDLLHAWCHDQLWPEVQTLPPWRVIVVRPDVANPGFEDVVFSFHHSLMDGTSAKNFHEELLTALNQVDEGAEPPHVLEFPELPVLPKTQEELIKYTNSIFFVSRVVWAELGPSFLKRPKPAIWNGERIDLQLPHKARILSLDIPAEVVSTMLSECRKHSSSITALLHALCLTSFARRLPPKDSPSFKAATPINARRYIKVPTDSEDITLFRVAVATMEHEWPSVDLDALRTTETSAGKLNNLIWDHARKIRTHLQARTASLPADDPVSLLKYIPDWETFWKKKQGQQRDYSWEISNIGALKRPEDGRRKITRAMFTNGIIVAGPPLCLNVVSVPDGPLTLTISWNQDVVPEELMKGLLEDLSTYTTHLHETGKLTV